MSNGDVIWRQRLWVWLPALVFFLANAAAFSVYRFGFAGDVALARTRPRAAQRGARAAAQAAHASSSS